MAGAPGLRSVSLPWPVFVGVALVLVALPVLPHVLAPDAVASAERLEPGSRQYVRAGFQVVAGDALTGRVQAATGPPVLLYIMDEQQLQDFVASGFAVAWFAAAGAEVNFSFTAPFSGVLHLVVGHTVGNETTESILEVHARVLVNPLLFSTSVGAEAAGAVLFVVGVRRHAKAVLLRREAARREGRLGRARGRRKKRPRDEP